MKNQVKFFLIFLIIMLSVILKPKEFVLRQILALNKIEQQGPYKRIIFLDEIYNKLNEITESDFLLKFSKLESFTHDFASKLNSKRYSLKLSSTKHTEFEVSVQNINNRFKIDNSNLPLPKEGINLNTFKNDWQSFQVLIIPMEDNIEGIEVSVAKKDINELEFESFIGEFVYCKKPYYQTEYEGWFADPLIPLFKIEKKDSLIFKDINFKFLVKKNQNKSIWFNVYTPKKTRQKTFKIPIKIKVNDITKTINLKLNVNDKVLASEKKFKDIFAFQEDHLITWNNFDTNLIVNKRNEYYDFLLKYNLNPINIYEKKTWPPISDWKYCKNRGANFVNFTYLGQWKCDSLNYYSFKKALKAIDETYQRKSIMVYLADEVNTLNIDKVNKRYSLYKNLIKNFNVAYTTAEHKINSNNLFNTFKLKKISDLLLNDTSSWNYICNTSTDTNKNFFIDRPLSEIQELGIILKKMNKKAFLYYGINEWKHNFRQDTIFNKLYSKYDKWPYKDWNSFTYKNYNGDGHLVYPGLNGEIWPSIRLIHIREMLTYLNN